MNIKEGEADRYIERKREREESMSAHQHGSLTTIIISVSLICNCLKAIGSTFGFILICFYIRLDNKQRNFKAAEIFCFSYTFTKQTYYIEYYWNFKMFKDSLPYVFRLTLIMLLASVYH